MALKNLEATLVNSADSKVHTAGYAQFSRRFRFDASELQAAKDGGGDASVKPLTPEVFQAALKKVSRKLSAAEDAEWSAKAKAGRASGMLTANATADRRKRRLSADS